MDSAQFFTTQEPSGWEYSWRNRPREVKWFPPSHVATKWEPGVLPQLCQKPRPASQPMTLQVAALSEVLAFPKHLLWCFLVRQNIWLEREPSCFDSCLRCGFPHLGYCCVARIIFRICTSPVWWLPWLLFLWYYSPPLLISKECFQAANLGRRSQLLELKKKKTKGEVPKRKV